MSVTFTKDPNSSEFVHALKVKINNYFDEKKISKHANLEMIIKSILGFSMWIFSYTLLFISNLSTIEFFVLYLFHGFWHLFIAFNIAHDANHNAYSRHERINKLFSYVFDLVGVNSYMWRMMHNKSHHTYVNIQEADVALASNKLFRFSPEETKRWNHQFQHIYASFIYCLATFEWVLLKDFNWFFFKKKIGNNVHVQHPLKEYIILLVTKAFYYTYILFIPIFYLNYSVGLVVLSFIAMHCCIGLTMAVIFQTTHIIEGTTYPKADEKGRVDNNYIQHIFETTADYAWRNPIVNWFCGCLNVHVIHHFYPNVCHVHNPALTYLIRDTAREFGIEYRENPSILSAYLSHLKMLKRLGNH